jgi:hypothetical protein
MMSIQMNSTQTTQTRTNKNFWFVVVPKHQRERQSPLGVGTTVILTFATINVMSSLKVEGLVQCILVDAILGKWEGIFWM